MALSNNFLTNIKRRQLGFMMPAPLHKSNLSWGVLRDHPQIMSKSTQKAWGKSHPKKRKIKQGLIRTWLYCTSLWNDVWYAWFFVICMTWHGKNDHFQAFLNGQNASLELISVHQTIKVDSTVALSYLVGRPTRWSLLFIFGFLIWSSIFLSIYLYFYLYFPNPINREI